MATRNLSKGYQPNTNKNERHRKCKARNEQTNLREKSEIDDTARRWATLEKC